MAWYPASYPGPAAWRSGLSVPVSCCLSAAGLRFLGILFPPRNSALLTVGLPALAHRTLTGFPCSARVRCGWGKGVLYTPGTAVPTRPRMLHDRRLPHHSGASLLSPVLHPGPGSHADEASSRISG